jgi:hypothetical protein
MVVFDLLNYRQKTYEITPDENSCIPTLRCFLLRIYRNKLVCHLLIGLTLDEQRKSPEVFSLENVSPLLGMKVRYYLSFTSFFFSFSSYIAPKTIPRAGPRAIPRIISSIKRPSIKPNDMPRERSSATESSFSSSLSFSFSSVELPIYFSAL